MVVSLAASLYHVGLSDSSSHFVFIWIFIPAGVTLKCKNDLGFSEHCGAAVVAQMRMMLYTEFAEFSRKSSQMAVRSHFNQSSYAHSICKQQMFFV